MVTKRELVELGAVAVVFLAAVAAVVSTTLKQLIENYGFLWADWGVTAVIWLLFLWVLRRHILLGVTTHK